ncbi:lysM domain-containing GPI-anchored protein 2 isoform X1 [Manihot esculenta]|uniref:Uncharacterized protein n=1 Tax=Manihot esculenta TaxID=3983 RepID=A0ACB7HUE5_MANES|nr:lysM domain-containing GPI-anchored protein 2 isoform X1 [Manihot esculenta]KAG8655771.1 hypothetical protein MANES_04G065032v8 [Manihot esculenta]
MDFSHHIIISLLFLFAFATKPSTVQAGFKCTQSDRTTCTSLIGYKSPNQTTIFHLSNFFGVHDINSLLGANDLPLSTPSNYTVNAQQVINIPIPCRCANGTGISNNIPRYRVQKDDTLFYIASDVFGGLVKFPEIQQVNQIPNANLIVTGERLWIPLPCSCDDVEEQRVVHYGHVVEAMSTMEGIAKQFGTTSDVLFKLNDISDDSKLIAGNAIDIPLTACNSSVSNSSLDYPLLVSNGTYVFTANGCMRCSCDSAKDWTLQCQPSGLRPANNTWQTCPSMLCEGLDILSVGNTTAVGCNQTTCDYSGFSNQSILTTLATVNTCPASNPGPDENKSSMIGQRWKFLFISLHLIMLCLHLLW